MPAGAARRRAPTRASRAARARCGADGRGLARPTAADGHAAIDELGAYRVLRVADPDGPAPAAGPVRDARGGRALGRGGGRAAISGARLLDRPLARRRGPVPARGRGARHEAAVRAARRASGCGRSARSAGLRRAAGRRRARCWWAAAWGSRRWRSCRTSWSRRMAASERRRCSGLSRRPARGGRGAAARRAGGDRRRLGRHHGLVTELLARGARARRRTRPCTPAAGADAGGRQSDVRTRATCPRSSRSRRAWPAGSARATDASCPGATAAICACASTAR